MTGKPTPVVAVGIPGQDLRPLESILARPDWDLISVADVDNAARVLRVNRGRIVLLDRDGAGAAWRTVLERLAESSRGASILLVSRVSDDYLWNEVIQAGGYDVVTKPFRKHELLTAIHFALRERQPQQASG